MWIPLIVGVIAAALGVAMIAAPAKVNQVNTAVRRQVLGFTGDFGSKEYGNWVYVVLGCFFLLLGTAVSILSILAIVRGVDVAN